MFRFWCIGLALLTVCNSQLIAKPHTFAVNKNYIAAVVGGAIALPLMYKLYNRAEAIQAAREEAQRALQSNLQEIDKLCTALNTKQVDFLANGKAAGKSALRTLKFYRLLGLLNSEDAHLTAVLQETIRTYNAFYALWSKQSKGVLPLLSMLEQIIESKRSQDEQFCTQLQKLEDSNFIDETNELGHYNYESAMVGDEIIQALADVYEFLGDTGHWNLLTNTQQKDLEQIGAFAQNHRQHARQLKALSGLWLTTGLVQELLLNVPGLEETLAALETGDCSEHNLLFIAHLPGNITKLRAAHNDALADLKPYLKDLTPHQIEIATNLLQKINDAATVADRIANIYKQHDLFLDAAVSLIHVIEPIITKAQQMAGNENPGIIQQFLASASQDQLVDLTNSGRKFIPRSHSESFKAVLCRAVFLYEKNDLYMLELILNNDGQFPVSAEYRKHCSHAVELFKRILAGLKDNPLYDELAFLS